MRTACTICIIFSLSTGSVRAAHPAGIGHDVHNYVLRARPAVEIVADGLSDAQLTDSRTMRTVSYFDGLGRPVGECVLGAGGSGEDIYTLIDYDERGLEIRRWQPVPLQATNGALPTSDDFAASSASFYGDERAFTATAYEPSALRRPESVIAAGNVLRKHPSRTSYTYNTASGDLALQRYELVGGLIKNRGYYAPSTLRVTESSDADGRRVIVFEDSEGVKLCRRLITDDGTYADTRWIYDIYGDLRFVLMPEIANSMGASAGINQSTVKAHSYYYTYDERHRVTRYREPGCDYVYNVYDAFGRLVLTQSAEQRKSNQWSCLMYDSGHRKAVQGILTTKRSQSTLASMLDTVMIVATRSNDYDNLFYDCSAAPGDFEACQSWLYDDYEFMEDTRMPQAPAAAGDVATLSGRSMLTGMAFKLDNTVFLRAIAYDCKARPVTEMEYDYYGLSYRLSRFMRYDFRGNTIWQCERYEKIVEQMVSESHQVALRHTLDHADRVIRTDYNTSDDISPLSWKVLRSTAYDALGRTATAEDAVTTSYTYDVQSRMTGISSPVLKQQLYYGVCPLDSTTPDYSGNLVAVAERRGNASAESVIRYGYDRLGRMVSARGSAFAETLGFDLNSNVTRITRSWRGIPAADTHISMAGNLVGDVTEYADDRLAGVVPRIRCGDYPAAATYDSDGRLLADSTRSIASVTYCDWNRCMPKKIDMGTNNVILRYRTDGQLAERRDTRYYMELYTDRNGVTKERRRITMTTRNYYGNFEVVGSKWRYNLAGAHITLSDGDVHYYARDYMGSTRAVYTGMTSIAPLSAISVTRVPRYTVEQATDYFPTGVPVDVTDEVTAEVSASASTDRLHIGNHWLDQGGLGWYDNTARYYDPLLARFTSSDPLNYKRPWDSPWSHCAGNPVNLIDPDGRDICVIYAPFLNIGHLGILIQHEDKRWYLYSKNGVNSGDSSGSFSLGCNEFLSGGEHLADLGELSFGSPQEFLDSDYNNSRSTPYSEGVAFVTTPEQDAAAIEAVTTEISRSYDLLMSNCAQSVLAAIKAIGLNDRSSKILETFSYAPVPGIMMQSTSSAEDAVPFLLLIKIKAENEGEVIYLKHE